MAIYIMMFIRSSKEVSVMNLVIRNYISSALVVVVSSVMLGNLYNQSFGSGSQDRVDTFGRYVSAGLVAQAQNIGE
jgi:hypothetical protein